jgi:D-alanyl-D-alanine carboxypeptidase
VGSQRTAITAIAAVTSVLAGACSAGDRAASAGTTATVATTTQTNATALELTTSAGTTATVAPTTQTTDAAPGLTAALEALVNEAVSHTPSIPGLLLHVEAPHQGLDVSVAAGLDDRATGAALSPDAGFRIASNTKTFTAAAILRLVEQGALALDDPIADRLAPETVDALRAGGYRPDAITVRQLLLHTSGVYDYGQDPAYQAAVAADPARRWTRLDQVYWAIDHGGPMGGPGERYAYSDTGYILLGEIAERSSGAPLAQAVRTLLDFGRLALDETYWESLEPAPPGITGRAHQYIGDLDGYGLDPSFDLYGAAGLISTVDDLSTFYRALLRGELFARPQTLATMLQIPASNAGPQAGMGIFRHDVAGVTCWGNAGMWGTFVVTCPDIDVTIAVSIDQAMPGPDYSEDEILSQTFALVTGR